MVRCEQVCDDGVVTETERGRDVRGQGGRPPVGGGSGGDNGCWVLWSPAYLRHRHSLVVVVNDKSAISHGVARWRILEAVALVVVCREDQDVADEVKLGRHHMILRSASFLES